MNVIAWLGTVFATLFEEHQPALLVAGFLSWLSVTSKNGALTGLISRVPGRAHDVLIVAVPTLLAGWQAHGAGSPLAAACVAGAVAGAVALLAQRAASRGFPTDSVVKTLEAVEAKGLDAKEFARELVAELAANPDLAKFLAGLLSTQPQPQPINVVQTFTQAEPAPAAVDADAGSPKGVG